MAIGGGRHGGFLMGAALAPAPRAFKAVLVRPGYDESLRCAAAPDGAFNTTAPGTVQRMELIENCCCPRGSIVAVLRLQARRVD